jgi:hypothetical protein
MCPIKFDVLEFDHIVEFANDATVFAAARENGNGHIRLFLIHQGTGNVYARNGRIESWEQLFGSERDSIIARVVHARNHHAPVYRINGTSAEYQAA